MRRRFFVDQFSEQTAILSGEPAHHLGQVLRAEAGQLYELSDGQSVWLGRIERIARDRIEFSLVEPVPTRELALRVALLLAIVKFDRFEWCLEKATELGVSEIVPLAAALSEKGLLAAAAKRAVRWQKILLESAQQSRRLRVPVLQPLAKPKNAFATPAAQHAVLLFLSERQDAPSIRDVLEAKKGSSAVLAIGPEGGWTDDELAAARGAGFLEASLGPNILRSETAVIAALAILNYALGE